MWASVSSCCPALPRPVSSRDSPQLAGLDATHASPVPCSLAPLTATASPPCCESPCQEDASMASGLGWAGSLPLPPRHPLGCEGRRRRWWRVTGRDFLTCPLNLSSGAVAMASGYCPHRTWESLRPHSRVLRPPAQHTWPLRAPLELNRLSPVTSGEQMAPLRGRCSRARSQPCTCILALGSLGQPCLSPLR